MHQQSSAGVNNSETRSANDIPDDVLREICDMLDVTSRARIASTSRAFKSLTSLSKSLVLQHVFTTICTLIQRDIIPNTMHRHDTTTFIADFTPVSRGRYKKKPYTLVITWRNGRHGRMNVNFTNSRFKVLFKRTEIYDSQDAIIPNSAIVEMFNGAFVLNTKIKELLDDCESVNMHLDAKPISLKNFDSLIRTRLPVFCYLHVGDARLYPTTRSNDCRSLECTMETLFEYERRFSP